MSFPLVISLREFPRAEINATAAQLRYEGMIKDRL